MCTNDTILKHINTFNYLEIIVSYETEKSFRIKTVYSVKILRIINQIFKPSLASRQSRIRRLRSGLSYGSES